MYLNKLTVYKGDVTLRQVEFKKGLNIIANTIVADGGTGNSVGKSTLSRLVDFLFLSNGEDIYKEKENGNFIPQMYSFISDNVIMIELEFYDSSQERQVISRNLAIDRKKFKYYVNNVALDRPGYEDFVASKVFGLTSDKPSLRNTASKFIRNTNDKMQNTTKFLHANTKPDIYDQLYLFLFGFDGLDLLRDKGKVQNEINNKKKHLAAYRNPYRESTLRKMIKPLEKEADVISGKIEVFNILGVEDANVRDLVYIQKEISSLTIKYSNLKARSSNIGKTIEQFKASVTNVNDKELFELYRDAGVSISDHLKKSFEDLVVFHNAIISNKIDFLSQGLQECKLNEDEIKSKIINLQEEETGLFKSIKEPSILKSLGMLYSELSSIKEKIAKSQALLDRIEDVKSELESLENSKSRIVDKIVSETTTLDENVAEFNRFFGDLSSKFYGERYIFDLVFDADIKKCRFEVINIVPNSTGGKKKGELSAFDIGYIEFVNSIGLPRPRFVIHDSIEDVDDNQVFEIFSKANNINGQYIVAVMRDKINSWRFTDFVENSLILELSEDDKFFKI
ncbi:DUF2326 domain-containing protein [Cobetia amphilecti]|uniref:DUF2326 domain-containing protein n=1 Tax=Cobetia amphilecti TaxID=1055104 RepID=UPI00254CEC6A|nr:DUF2326 domain-containing protein [Cobetia amphilecti]